MVDAHDSKSCSERSGGSSPLSGTRTRRSEDDGLRRGRAKI